MFKFTPLICEEINEYIDNKELVFDTLNCFGSPCNVVFPSVMDKNIEAFKNVFKKYSMSGKIFYAHKCNKSQALVKQALYNDINIDVASENELKDVLAAGFTGARIEATGPKNKDFIYLGVLQNITFNVDNLEELKDIIKTIKLVKKKEKTKILIRLCGFKSEETKIANKQSRFGIPLHLFDECLKILKENEKHLQFLGIAFHLDTIAINEKIIAIENCIELFEKSFEMGFDPYVLDIGGGYKVNYILDKKEWNDSISELKESILSKEKDLTWNNASFGLRQEKGVLRGALNIYNYYDESVGAKYLDDILATPLKKYQNRSIGEILQENMICLYIEPGKALLDQVGINLARITYSKTSENGNILVGVDMKKSDLVIGEQEMFLDPIILSKEKEEPTSEGMYFIGNLCMENDFIYKHKVFPGKLVKKDDCMIFPNTAGYFMDFEQSKTIMQRVSKKVICKNVNGKLKFYLDDTYNPFDI